MPVYLTTRVRKERLREKALRNTAQRLLEAIGEPQATLSLTFVGDRAIRTLNRMYRSKDKATDVLSFPLFEPREAGRPIADTEKMLGDVVISVDTARRQAAAYGASLEREIQRLMIHGILHLMGHDHEVARERRRMEIEERRLAAAIQMPWPY